MPLQLKHLIIVGASVRAAVESAYRAGLSVVAVDLMADLDTRQAATRCVRLDRLQDADRVLARLPKTYCMLAGGMENHRRTMRRIGQRHALLGCSPRTLAAVRDTPTLFAKLAQAGFAVPPTLAGTAVPNLGRGPWLLKRRASAGGGQILQVDRDFNIDRAVRRRSYWQQLVEGQVAGATFVAGREECRLLGVCSQIADATAPEGCRFRYAGSIGPVRLSPPIEHRLNALGQWLVEHCRLRGLFGVDFALNGEQVWPLEINPRYPASAELIERATGQSMVQLHVDSCLDLQTPDALNRVSGRNRSWISPQGHPTGGRQAIAAAANVMWGKAIIYADDRSRSATELLSRELQRLAYVADIPSPGTWIRQGHPVCTVLALAADHALVTRELESRIEHVRLLIGSTT